MTNPENADSTTSAELPIRFVCDYCDETLPVELDDDCIWHNEFHRCHGEELGLVGLIFDKGAKTTKVGVNIEPARLEHTQ